MGAGPRRRTTSDPASPADVEREGRGCAEFGCLLLLLAPVLIAAVFVGFVMTINWASPPVTMTPRIDGAPAGREACDVRDWMFAEKGPQFASDSANIRRQCADAWWDVRRPRPAMLAFLGAVVMVAAAGFVLVRRRPWTRE